MPLARTASLLLLTLALTATDAEARHHRHRRAGSCGGATATYSTTTYSTCGASATAQPVLRIATLPPVRVTAPQSPAFTQWLHEMRLRNAP